VAFLQGHFLTTGNVLAMEKSPSVQWGIFALSVEAQSLFDSVKRPHLVDGAFLLGTFNGLSDDVTTQKGRIG
jgi:hypothetical protein